MGTYTSSWNLLKAGGADYVDVESQLNRNLRIIDDRAKKTLEYTALDVDKAGLPTSGYLNGDKVFNHQDGGIYRNISPGNWFRIYPASAQDWTDIPLSAGWENVGGNTPRAGYSTDTTSSNTGANYTIRLRGRIRQTGNAAFTQNTLYNPTADGGLPGPSTDYYSYGSGGVAPGSTASYFRIFISLAGRLEVRRFSNTAQTAGSAENYVSLDGVSYYPSL